MKYTIMTFNIRIDVITDGKHRFSKRLPLILDTLEKLNLDIICFQEITRKMYKKLTPLLEKYDVVGEYRDDEIFGEANFIFIKKNKFKIVNHETRWLSPTPLIPKTRYKGDQSILPRIITSVRLQTLDNKYFNVFNTHFDHEGINSRLESAKQISQQINEIKDIEPLILTGDFNAKPNENSIKILTQSLIDTTSNILHTFHQYGKDNSNNKIDYIFVNKMIKYLPTQIIISHQKGHYLSDHHPILMNFEI